MESATADPVLITAVEQFLYDEAALLDERRYEEWLALFTPDSRYTMPIVSTRESGEDEIGPPGDLAYVDDTIETLTLRIKRLYTGKAWSEEPPSRTTRFISNVRVAPPRGSDYDVRCNFIVYRTRLEKEVDLFVGARADQLRREGDGWRIAQRSIVLKQSVLPHNNLSVFF